MRNIRQRVVVTTLVLLVVVSVMGSLLTTTPRPLPGVALGSIPLLHVLRSLIFFAAGLAVLVVLRRAWEGQLPSEMSTSGLKYGVGEAVVENMSVINDAISRIDRLERMQSKVDEDLLVKVDNTEEVE